MHPLLTWTAFLTSVVELASGPSSSVRSIPLPTLLFPLLPPLPQTNDVCVADEHPDSDVLGVDLAPVQPNS